MSMLGPLLRGRELDAALYGGLWTWRPWRSTGDLEMPDDIRHGEEGDAYMHIVIDCKDTSSNTNPQRWDPIGDINCAREQRCMYYAFPGPNESPKREGGEDAQFRATIRGTIRELNGVVPSNQGVSAYVTSINEKLVAINVGQVEFRLRLVEMDEYIGSKRSRMRYLVKPTYGIEPDPFSMGLADAYETDPIITHNNPAAMDDKVHCQDDILALGEVDARYPTSRAVQVQLGERTIWVKCKWESVQESVVTGTAGITGTTGTAGGDRTIFLMKNVVK